MDDTENDKITDAVNTAVAALRDELTAKHDADIKGLKTKNSELIARNKELAGTTDRLEEAKAEATGDIEVLKARHADTIARLERARDEAFSTRDTLLIDNTLREQLVAGNVAKHFHPVLYDAMRAKAKVEDGAGTIDGQPIRDYVASFLKGDEGKHWVSAPANSGGGAQTPRGEARSWQTAPVTAADYQAFDKLPTEERKALADQWGRPDLKV